MYCFSSEKKTFQLALLREITDVESERYTKRINNSYEQNSKIRSFFLTLEQVIQAYVIMTVFSYTEACSSSK